MSFVENFIRIQTLLKKEYDIDIDINKYDSFIVKKMASTNCLTKEGTSKQTHIAITGKQMDMFPYIYLNGYMEENDKKIKNFLVLKAPIHIFKKNCEVLEKCNIDFNSNEFLKEYVCIYSRKNVNGSIQIQLSMLNDDSENFIKYRYLIKEDDYLVILKYKEKIEYDTFIVEKKFSQNIIDLNKTFEVLEKKESTFILGDKVDIIKETISDDIDLIECNVKDYNIQDIYFGAPGTGKSYGVSQLIKECYPEISEKDNPFVFKTTIYSDYSYYNFIGSVMPISKNGEIKYEFKPGIFSQALLQAFKHPKKEIFLIVEEMSRGNIASIFGDIFQLLDRNEYGVSEYSINNDLISEYFKENKILENEKIYLPRNFHIIGTVNTSDQNVNVIDTAFKRRFSFIYVDVNPIKEENKYLNSYSFILKDNEKEINFEWNKLYLSLNEFIIKNLNLNEDKQIGQFFIKFNNYKESEQKYRELQNKLIHYLWDDIQGAAISDQYNIFKKEYFNFSSLYKDFGDKKNIFSDDFLKIYNEKVMP